MNNNNNTTRKNLENRISKLRFVDNARERALADLAATPEKLLFTWEVRCRKNDADLLDELNYLYR